LIKINGASVEASYMEFGIRWDDDSVTGFEDEAEARDALRMSVDASLVARAVYEMAWADVTVTA
jgi:hypothetical protein